MATPPPGSINLPTIAEGGLLLEDVFPNLVPSQEGGQQLNREPQTHSKGGPIPVLC